MVANSLQLLALRRNAFAVPCLDLVRRRAILGEATRDDDALAVLFGLEGFFALVLQLNTDFCHAEQIYQSGTGEQRIIAWDNHLWPSRMNDFKPVPRPVDVALPPRATVRADRTALYPPACLVSIQPLRSKRGSTDFRCVLGSMLDGRS